jgi:hypothetical protein
MKRTVTSIICTSVLVGLALPSAAAAQERRGFWFNAGGGVGSATVTCDDCDSGRETGGVGTFRIGGSLSERVLLGAEFNLWAKKYAIEPGVDGTVNLYNLSGTVAYYPTGSGFFVKGGAGVAIADVDINIEGTTVTVDIGTGFGLVTGAGYDIPLSRRWSITPGVNFWYGQLGNTTLGGEPFANNWKQNVVDFTIGITFR